MSLFRRKEPEPDPVLVALQKEARAPRCAQRSAGGALRDRASAARRPAHPGPARALRCC